MFVLQIPYLKVHEIAARFLAENPKDFSSVKNAFIAMTGKNYEWNELIREIEFETEEEMIAFKLAWL